MTYLINMFTYNDNVLIFALLRVDKNGVQEKNKQIFYKNESWSLLTKLKQIRGICFYTGKTHWANIYVKCLRIRPTYFMCHRVESSDVYWRHAPV